MNLRSSGILLHPTSLFNRFPIGDLGPAAAEFIEFLVQSGQDRWQMLPIGPTGEGDSPYQSSSAFAGNPLLVSPDRLMEKGLLTRQDIGIPPGKNEGKVDYPTAARLNRVWLQKAFENFNKKRRSGKQSMFEEFARSESSWLEDFSLFASIQGKEGALNWTRWDPELRTRQPEALLRAGKYFAKEILYHQFVQWEFAEQWKELRVQCASNGIGLIGDVPLFVAYQSADVWAHPGLFKLNADGNPAVVAGVPPDYFSKTGQVWGVPVYDWGALQKQNYKWWIERLRKAFERFDSNRLDHFIGFVRTYEVPAQAKTAEKGRYQPGGGVSFFHSVREALGELPLIADDLGATTPEVTDLMDQFQIPGTRVLQFEYVADSGTPSDRPAPRPKKSVVYTGNHDNDTTAGWYRKLPAPQREILQKKLGTNDREMVWAVIREALASRTEAALVPAQDLLELGSEARMNFPGTAEGNWQWRLKEGALTLEIARRLGILTWTYRRLQDGDPCPAPPFFNEDELRPRIAGRAHELYEREGRQDDQTTQNWLRAEMEIKMEAKG